mgnify:CR=1 FL=1|tara:strand:+ start:14467 stop:15456 length:990 start_codon:yes stop_codon:yes gene_type:complete
MSIIVKIKKIYNRIESVAKIVQFSLKGYQIVVLENPLNTENLIHLREKEIIREKVYSAFCSIIVPESAAGQVRLRDYAESVTSLILGTDERGPLSRFDSIVKDHLSNVWTNTVVASGVTTLWEIKLRTIASRLEIETRLSGDLKRTKNKNLVAPGFRKIEKIIPELRVKAPNLKINLERLLALRGSLVHGNLRELRQIFLNGLKKDLHRENQASVFMLNLNSNESVDLSSNLTNDFVDSVDDFGLLLEGGTSELLNNVMSEFGNALLKLDLLIEFSAHSEIIDLFRKLASGHKLNFDDRNRLDAALGKTSGNSNFVSDFLKKIEDICLK